MPPREMDRRRVGPEQRVICHVPHIPRLEEICESWIADLLGLPPVPRRRRQRLVRRHTLRARGGPQRAAAQAGLGRGARRALRRAAHPRGWGNRRIPRYSRRWPCWGWGRTGWNWPPPTAKGALSRKNCTNWTQYPAYPAGRACNSGAFDPMDEICDIARASGAWIHVDGAFGLWAAASKRNIPDQRV